MANRNIIKKRLEIARGHLSQLEVERLARKHFKHFPKGKYWRIENGYDAPSPKEQDAIAKALGAQPSELFDTAASA